MLPWALGQELTCAEGEGPVLPPIRTREQIEALDVKAVRGAIAPILETVRQVRAALIKREEEGEGVAALIGFAGSPFTVACYMVEGGGSKEFTHVRAMAHGEPELFDLLIEKIVAATITYLSAQVLSGAEAWMLFDSWSVILSPRLFRRYVIEPTRVIAAKLRERFPNTPMIGFPRLAGLMVGEYARDSGVQAVALDTSADPVVAASMIPKHIAIQGNLDPLALIAGGEALRQEADDVLQALKGRPHIFNLGHGILPQTNPDHVRALVEQIRNA